MYIYMRQRKYVSIHVYIHTYMHMLMYINTHTICTYINKHIYNTIHSLRQFSDKVCGNLYIAGTYIYEEWVYISGVYIHVEWVYIYT